MQSVCKTLEPEDVCDKTQRRLILQVSVHVAKSLLFQLNAYHHQVAELELDAMVNHSKQILAHNHPIKFYIASLRQYLDRYQERLRLKNKELRFQKSVYLGTLKRT